MGVPPSASLTDTVHVSVAVVVAPLLALMAMESMLGSVLVTLTDVLSLVLSPWVSVAVAVQVMMSAGADVLGVSGSAVPLPRELFCVSFVQA